MDQYERTTSNQMRTRSGSYNGSNRTVDRSGSRNPSSRTVDRSGSRNSSYRSEERPYQPPRRRRRRRKPPYKALAICAAIIFAVGFLCGFLIRGLFIPDAPEITQETQPAGNVGSLPSSEPTEPTEFHVGNVSEDWRLLLVNKWNPLSQDYTAEYTPLSNGLLVNEKCYDDLMDMLNAMEKAGLSPIVCSAYRSVSDQQALYNDKIDELVAQGYSRTEAEQETGTVVAVPGTSEHHTGLAVDIVDESNQILDENQEKTEVQQWLMENCWDYGFILRYPNNKSDITGIIYEPWHYRYVGKEIAKDIKARNVCLEEYLELFAEN